MKMKTAIGAIGATALLAAAVLAPAGPASAHVTASPAETLAGEYQRLEFSVPHGCEGSATTRVRVQVPEQVPSATPQRNPLWDLRAKEGPKQPTEAHGETIVRGVSEIIWTAKRALPDNELDVLGMSVLMPDAAGETVYFPTIQECERGENRWIQVPGAGEDPHSLPEPAPAVLLGSAEDGHGAEAADGEKGAPTWLVIVALAAGLLAGGALSRAHWAVSTRR